MNRVSNQNLKNTIKSIVELIKDNKSIFEKIQKEDSKPFDFKIEKLIKIFESYKYEQVEDKESEKVIMHFYGNPYLTAMLCIESLIHQTESIFIINNIHYGLNSAIVKIVNDSLKKNGMSAKFQVVVNFMEQEIKQMEVHKIICLGDSNSYNVYRQIKDTNVKCIPLFGTNVYYDSNEYTDLVENMEKFAFENGYEMEVYHENEELDDVMYMINKSENNYCSLILSKDKQKQEQFTNQVNAKIVCVNENPFTKFKLEVPKDVWK